MTSHKDVLKITWLDRVEHYTDDRPGLFFYSWLILLRNIQPQLWTQYAIISVFENVRMQDINPFFKVGIHAFISKSINCNKITPLQYPTQFHKHMTKNKSLEASHSLHYTFKSSEIYLELILRQSNKYFVEFQKLTTILRRGDNIFSRIFKTMCKWTV